MIPGQENFRNTHSAVFMRPRILGIRQQLIFEALVDQGIHVTQNIRNMTRHRVNQYGCRQATVGQNIVAYAYFPVNQLVSYPLINSLVMPADKQKMFFNANSLAMEGLRGSPSGAM